MQSLQISPAPTFALPSRGGAGQENLSDETEVDIPCFTLGEEEVTATIPPEFPPGDALFGVPVATVSVLTHMQMPEASPTEEVLPARAAASDALAEAETDADLVTIPADGMVPPVPLAALPLPSDSAEEEPASFMGIDDPADPEKVAAPTIMPHPGMPLFAPHPGQEAPVVGDRSVGRETEIAEARASVPEVHSANTAYAETVSRTPLPDSGDEAAEALPHVERIASPASAVPGEAPEAAVPTPRDDWRMARSEMALRFRAGLLPLPFILGTPPDSPIVLPDAASDTAATGLPPGPAPGIGPPILAAPLPDAATLPDRAPPPQAGVVAFMSVTSSTTEGIALPEGMNAIAVSEEVIAVSPAPAPAPAPSVSALAFPPEGTAAAPAPDTARAMADLDMAALPQPARDNNRAVTVVPSVGGTAGDSTTVGDGETLKGAEPGSQDLPPGRPVPEAAPERTRSPVLAPGDGFSSAQALAVPADEAVFTAAIPPPATAHPDPALPPIANRPLPATLPVQIAHAAVSAEGPVTELRLSPEELGSVRIELVTEGEKVSVTILAERPETLDLMRRHADRLAAELRTAGFSQLDLGFGQGGAGETGSRAEAGGRIFHGNTADSPGPVPVAAPRPMAGSNLYLRL